MKSVLVIEYEPAIAKRCAGARERGHPVQVPQWHRGARGTQDTDADIVIVTS